MSLRLSITVIVEENGRREQGYSGGGGRRDYAFFDDTLIAQSAKQAVDQALLNLRARPAPAGTTTVVLDPHEIANVLGIEGIRALLHGADEVPLDAYVMVSSCV